jgi:RHS repeat-associated protein
MKFRDGGPSLCVNAAPVRIAELVASDIPCGDLFAVTEVSFDDWGSYDAVLRPSNTLPDSCDDYPAQTVTADDLTFEDCASLDPADDATRYCVDYVYDEHRHTDIADVTDNHGVSSHATYEPRNGRLATRTDENGNLTTYTYDPQGRLESVIAPREQPGPPGSPATIAYHYGGLDATLNHAGAHTWATASSYDSFNDGNLIDTATFVDGMGRVVQRKRDAQVDGVSGEARIVEGAIEYDALGRAVKEWYPVVEQMATHQLTVYNTSTSESGPATTHVPVTAPIRRTYDVFDRLLLQTLPDGSVERVAYDFAVLPQYDGNITMSRVKATDPLGKTVTRWLDVGGAVFRSEEAAAPATNLPGDPLAALPASAALQAARIKASVSTPAVVPTRFDYDRLGRLITVIDAGGAVTTHTYDFQDNVTSTDTPDGGLVERTFAPSGQALTVARAVGTLATYEYDRDRLTGVTYNDDTPAVAYEYGDDPAENTVGRVNRVVDGSMDRTYGYDVDGNVARETATRAAAPWSNGTAGAPATWETIWRYDSLGRVDLLTYPDGEDLQYDYDLGGRPSSVISQAPQHTLYDQYGVAVPRADVEIVYISAVRYDQFGEATFLRTGTGVETRYTYQPARRFLATVDTDARAAAQYDGTTSTARPLQRLRYTYDSVGNVRDATNKLYDLPTDTKVTDLGPPPVNNVPGPSQHAYTYDGHYRLIGGTATYVDRTELRQYTYESDYAANGTLVSKRQVTTTTSTTSNKPGGSTSGNGKKGNGSGTGTTTTERTCESNTGSGGGSFNQDPETTYVIASGDLVYAEDGTADLHQLVRSGNRTYTYDDNGNMTGWVQPCAGGTSTISRTFEWDAENRVTRIAEGNNDTDYRYSAEGHRTLERGPGGVTWFVNEHWRTVNDGHRYANIFLGEQVIASHRTSSAASAPAPCTPTATNPCTCDSGDACRVVDVTQCNLATRVYDAATSTCQPKQTRTIHFLHKDLQGSMRVATDEVGKVFQYMEYVPNGRPWVAGQSTIKDTPYLFAGGWTDTTYDLVNFGERWYEPREENFLSPEPLLEENPYAAVDDPAVLSAYTYAASNPLRYVDPDGHDAKTAYNGYDLGENYKKHESGDITISVARREKRDAPAITFGGRYSNDADGQQVQAAFAKHADRAQRFSTVLSISTEDGVRKVRVFGVTAKRTQVADQAAPDPGPGDTGADAADAPTAPPRPVSAPPQPGAADSAAPSNSPPHGGSGASDGAGDGAAAAAPPQANAADAAGGDDAPAPKPPPSPSPNAAAPDDAGPDT